MGPWPETGMPLWVSFGLGLCPWGGEGVVTLALKQRCASKAGPLGPPQPRAGITRRVPGSPFQHTVGRQAV